VYLELLDHNVQVQVNSVPLTVTNFDQIANAMRHLLCSDSKTWSSSFKDLKRKFPEFFSDDFFQVIGVDEFNVKDDEGPTKFNHDLLVLIESFKTGVLGLGFTSSTIDSYIEIFDLDKSLMSDETFSKYAHAAQNEFDYDLTKWYEENKINITEMEQVD